MHDNSRSRHRQPERISVLPSSSKRRRDWSSSRTATRPLAGRSSKRSQSKAAPVLPAVNRLLAINVNSVYRFVPNVVVVHHHNNNLHSQVHFARTGRDGGAPSYHMSAHTPERSRLSARFVRDIWPSWSSSSSKPSTVLRLFVQAKGQSQHAHTGAPHGRAAVQVHGV